MQDKKPKLVKKTRYGFVPWWLIAGSEISGKILLVGHFYDDELQTLSSISKSLECIDYPSFLDIDKFYETRVCNTIDVVIIKSLGENKTFRFDQLSEKLKKLFDNFPIVIMLEENPLHIKRFFRDPLNIFKSIFFDVRAHQIEIQFFDRKINKYETLSYNDDPHESFPPGTYFTNKNPFRKIEKIKRLLLNSRLSRLFYSSQIWTIARDRKLFVDLLINEVQGSKKFKWERDQVRLLKLFFNNGKIILSLTSKIKNYPEYIIVVPLFEHSVKQRRNEKAAIEFLQSSKIGTQYFVDEIIEGEVDNRIYFAMKEFSGITVDLPNPGLGDMTENAVALVTSMANINDPSGSISAEKTITDISLELIELLIARYPYHEKVITRIGNMLEHYHGLPLISFMHGDTKLENFVFDQDTRQVVGIIDLELTEFPGIPLIDLFYLITYNYYILYHKTFFDTFTRIVRDELSPTYQIYIENYCRQHKINHKQKRICLVLFFLHHFGKRIFFREEYSVNKEEFEPGCQLIQQMLEDIPFDLAGTPD